MTKVTIEIPDDQLLALKSSATAQGLTLEGWFQKSVEREFQADAASRAQAAAVRIREIQKRSKPDPDGWTVHDYLNRDRR